jgi:hypothetical protein
MTAIAYIKLNQMVKRNAGNGELERNVFDPNGTPTAV